MRLSFLSKVLVLVAFMPLGMLASCGVSTNCTIASPNECPSNIVHPHTFFTPRQITFDQTFELALANYDIYHPRDCGNECAYGLHLYATPFYQQSRKGGCRLASFFLPNGKCSIALEQDGTGDVNPLWLQLSSPAATPFSSVFTINPVRTSAGALLYARWDLGSYFDCCWNGLWVSFNTAILHVIHDLNVCETPASQTTCPPFANAGAALNNPAWTAGKLSGDSTKRTGLDDIQVKLGYDWFSCDCDGLDHLSLYLVGGIPTGKRPASEFLFEPLVGSKHGSFGFGINFDNKIWSWCESDISWMADMKYRYVFSATERRSFDLCNNGDWSRYLLLANINDPFTPLPAINTLTTDVKVRPGSTIDFWTALHWERCNWGVEVGYDLFWRQTENVRLKEIPALTGLGIFDLRGASVLNPASASTATIAQSVAQVVSNATFVSLQASDLNVQSAAHPRALTHKFYGAVDYRLCWCDYPILLGIVGSYELARPKANALEQWAVFGKLGITF